MKKCLMVLVAVLAGTVSAEDLAIQYFERDGTITFKGIPNATAYQMDVGNDGIWTNSVAVPANGSGIVTASVPMIAQAMHYRVAATVTNPPAPDSMVLIPGGTNSGTNPLAEGEFYDSGYYPQTYSLTVESFYMDRYEVTLALWEEVKTSNGGNGYDLTGVGSGKAANHPVQEVSWF